MKNANQSCKLRILWNEVTKGFNKHSIIVGIFVGAVSTIIASVLITIVSTQIADKKAHKAMVDAINNLYVGCNKEWVDSKLGSATFINGSDNYLECVYVSDIAIVRTYYRKETNACDGLFVTAYSRKLSDRIYVSRLGDRLGSFSYYDIAGAPLNVAGYLTQGDARFLYSENYYYGVGIYHEFYFMTLDYGIEWDSSYYKHFDFSTDNDDICIDDEVSREQIRRDDVFYTNYYVVNRDKVHPNTYGILTHGISSESKKEIEEMLFSYRNFDCSQLRFNARKK